MGGGDHIDFRGGTFYGPVTGAAGSWNLPTRPMPPPPATLPAQPAFFTGRDTEVGELLSILAPPDQPGTVISQILALVGLGGVGKTALTVRVSHLAREREWFPGGTLFIDLRGYDDTPIPADQAVAALLQMLGIGDADLPQTPDAQYARFRSELADRPRMLIVLDNVSDPRQIWPLLPGEGMDHRVLITSRDVHDSLPIRQFRVSALSPEAASSFIDQSLRRQNPLDHRATDESDDVRELARLCGHLPLALSIAAALLLRRRHRPIATLTADLRNAADRLSALSSSGVDQYGKDLALRPVFDVMYARLGPRLAQVLRLLAQAPSDVVSVGAAVALAGLPERELESAVEDLVACSLLAPVRPFHNHGRWQMHDLVRLHARSVTENAPLLRFEAARARLALTAYYWQMLRTALGSIRGTPANDVPDVFGGDRSLALAWCDLERANLRSVVLWAQSDDKEQFDCAVALADTFTTYLRGNRHRRGYKELEIVARAVLAAADRFGERETQGLAWQWLGNALDGLRRFDEALDAYDHGEKIADELDDSRMVARIRADRGMTLYQSGRYEEGINAQTRALRALEDLGEHHSAASCRLNVAQILTLQGRQSEAHGHVSECLSFFVKVGDRVQEATTRRWLGTLLGQLGRFEEGIQAHTRALGLCAELGDWHGRAAGWGNLGGLWSAMGRHEDAVRAHGRARDWFTALDDHHQEAIAWRNLCSALLRLGRHDDALRAAYAARDLFEASGDRHGVASVLSQVSDIHMSEGRRREARAAITAVLALTKRGGLRQENTDP